MASGKTTTKRRSRATAAVPFDPNADRDMQLRLQAVRKNPGSLQAARKEYERLLSAGLACVALGVIAGCAGAPSQFHDKNVNPPKFTPTSANLEAGSAVSKQTLQKGPPR
jgi:hypothetical protein